MTDERDVLDRLTTAFPAPERSFERFTRRRERKRRNQRITSAMLAIVVATVAIGWAATVFLRDTKERPANSPTTITPRNVSSLHRTWAGQAGVIQGGILQPPFVAHGIAYVVSDRLYAFDAHCVGGEAACTTPLWESSHATNPEAVDSWAWPPAVADGVVYVVDRVDGVLYAYSESCGAAGAACAPLWTFQVGGPPAESTPVVQGSTLYVASFSRLYAFSTSCTHACRPTWAGRYHGHDGWEVNISAADGLVFVTRGGELWAFPESCDGSTCDSLWIAQLPRANFYASMSLAVDRGIVYVGRSDGGFRSQPLVSGLYAFDEGCGSGGVTCPPLWSWIRNIPMQLVAADGMVYEAGGRLLAFPAGCGSRGSRCEPSWRSDEIGAQSATIADRTVYVQTIRGIMAFPEACGTGNATCDPSWIGGQAVGPNGWGDRATGAPVIAEGVVFGAPYRERSLFAFGVSCGTGGSMCSPLWTGTTRELVTSAPIVAEGAIYVGTGDSKIVAFELSTPRPDPSSGGGSARWLLFAVGVGLLIGSVRMLVLRLVRRPRG